MYYGVKKILRSLTYTVYVVEFFMMKIYYGEQSVEGRYDEATRHRQRP